MYDIHRDHHFNEIFGHIERIKKLAGPGEADEITRSAFADFQKFATLFLFSVYDIGDASHHFEQIDKQACLCQKISKLVFKHFQIENNLA